MKIRGGRRGPVDLVSFKVLTISSRITFSGRFPSISIIDPLQVSFTPCI
jgi:hypothetical protein